MDEKLLNAPTLGLFGGSFDPFILGICKVSGKLINAYLWTRFILFLVRNRLLKANP